MEREEVIRMARDVWGSPDQYYSPTDDEIERFASLVAAAERERVSAVLVKCAEALQHYTGVVECVNDPNDFTPKVRDIGIHARDALVAIRELQANYILVGVEIRNTSAPYR